jgi:hypothetical protein
MMMMMAAAPELTLEALVRAIASEDLQELDDTLCAHGASLQALPDGEAQEWAGAALAAALTTGRHGIVRCLHGHGVLPEGCAAEDMLTGNDAPVAELLELGVEALLPDDCPPPWLRLFRLMMRAVNDLRARSSALGIAIQTMTDFGAEAVDLEAMLLPAPSGMELLHQVTLLRSQLDEAQP